MTPTRRHSTQQTASSNRNSRSQATNAVQRPAHRVWIVVVIVIAVILLLSAPVGICAWQVNGSADRLKSDVQTMNFSGVEQDIQDLVGVTDGPLWSLCKLYPGIGGDFSTIQSMMHGLNDELTPLLPTLNESLQSLDRDAIGLNASTISTLAAIGLEAKDPLAALAEQWQALPPLQIGFLEDRIGPYRETVINGATVLENIAPMLEKPEALTGPYLVLAMTNSEVKSIGGFPGAWISLSLSDDGISTGKTTSVPSGSAAAYIDDILTDEERSTFAAFDTPGIASPLEIPDFSRMGAVAVNYWEQKQHETPAWVIGVDPLCLQNIISAFKGDTLTLSDGTTLNKADLARTLLNQVYLDISGNSNQDVFFLQVAETALRTLSDLSAVDIPTLLGALADSIDDGHLMVYATDTAVETQLETVPLGGNRLDALTGGTFGLYFNDRSISKLAYYIRSNITIEGDKVTVQLTNTVKRTDVNELPRYISGASSFQRMPCDMLLWTYLYAPEGGSLSDVYVNGYTSNVSQTTFQGHELWQGVIYIYPGETITMTFTAQPASDYDGPISVDSTFFYQDSLT